MFSELPLANYEIRLISMEESSIYNFPGSALRGALGYALKKSVCVISHGDCGQCLLASRCAYSYIFETAWPEGIELTKGQRNAPHPFILDPPVYPRRKGKQVTPISSDSEAGRNERSRVHRLAAGDELVFGLTVIGRATEYLPYLIYAIREMAQSGLGVGRQPRLINRGISQDSQDSQDFLLLRGVFEVT